MASTPKTEPELDELLTRPDPHLVESMRRLNAKTLERRQTPSPGAVWPAMVMYGSVILSGEASVINPPTRKMTIFDDSCARREWGWDPVYTTPEAVIERFEKDEAANALRSRPMRSPWKLA